MSQRYFELDNRVHRPSPVSAQFSLFPEERDDALAQARVSVEDMAQWQALGWISYDVSTRQTLEYHELAEMLFIRNLARSGLSNAFISELLGELTTPYSYPPMTTAYSFALGWVEAVIPDMDSLVKNHLESWAQEKSILGQEEELERASLTLVIALAELRARKKSLDE